MPIYNFECQECKEVVERMCSISERKNQKCKCGAELKQMISVPHIHGMNSIGSSTSQKEVPFEDFPENII
jgi:putative FmdB family regulatory protein